MSSDAAVIAVVAVLRPISQPLEIACAAVRCRGSCGGLRRFQKTPAESRCGGSEAVAAWCPPYLYALRDAWSVSRADGQARSGGQ
jgi:hypothetical protein